MVLLSYSISLLSYLIMYYNVFGCGIYYNVSVKVFLVSLHGD